MSHEAESAPLTPGSAIRVLLAVAGVLLFFTSLESYGFAAWAFPRPVVWVALFAAAAAALSVAQPAAPNPLLRSPLLLWVLAYVVITAAWRIWVSTPTTAGLEELEDRIRSVAFILAFAVVFHDPRARKAAIVTVVLAVVAASALNVAELLGLASFASLPDIPRVAGRPAGFYINANRAGLAIALGAAAAVPALPRAARAPLLFVAAAGMAVTFSRGAATCFLVALAVLAARGDLGGRNLLLVGVAIPLLVYFGAGFLEGSGLLTDNTAARLAFEKDDSGRLALALKAWQLFLDAPVLGHGLAATAAWGEGQRAHNMFLTLAADHGFVGLALFPALAWAIVRGNREAAPFALALLVAGLFSHRVLDDRYLLLLATLAAAPAARRAPALADDRAEAASPVPAVAPLRS